MLNVIDMIRQIRNKNNIQVKRPLKNVSIYTDLDKLELLKKMEYYIINECNIIDIDYMIWESTKYKYMYEINFKVVGKFLVYITVSCYGMNFNGNSFKIYIDSGELKYEKTYVENDILISKGVYNDMIKLDI
jgi:hypothetical protein